HTYPPPPAPHTLSLPRRSSDLTTTYAYDAAGRVARVAEVIDDGGLSRFTETTYDAGGNKTLVSVRPSTYAAGVDPLLQRRDTKYDYDALNRLTKVTEAYADAASQQLNTDSLGHPSPVTAYEYSAADTRIKVTDPRGVVSTFAYDLFGNMTGQSKAVSY